MSQNVEKLKENHDESLKRNVRKLDKSFLKLKIVFILDISTSMKLVLKNTKRNILGKGINNYFKEDSRYNACISALQELVKVISS
jgi:CRISPR/Cas system CMR subunit Cmr6 (Cas7 group RAMP superfamily)